MDVRVKFLGGAGTVTGSKYLLEIDDYRVLVDCGLFQGLKELRLRNWNPLPELADSIDMVALTHAHIDHSGYLPKLVKDGFGGKIYCTEPTSALLEIMLLDAGRLQEEEARFARKKGYSKHEYPKPLFTAADAEQVLSHLETVPFKKTIRVNDSISLTFYQAGHILGAASIEVKINGDQQVKRLVFSGDLGPYENPLHFPPDELGFADILFIESTYGNRIKEPLNVEKELLDVIHKAEEQKGCVVIPAFSVGRTQLLLYYLSRLFENGNLNGWQVYIDSPMAISVTDIYKKYEYAHRLNSEAELGDTFDYPNFIYVRDQSVSKSLNERKRRAIIISASGMVTGGRILHHLFHRLRNPQDVVLFTGFQAEASRGRRILEKEETIKIFGEEVPVKANIREIKGLSAHGDQNDLLRWTSSFVSSPKMTFVVHGENESANQLKHLLEAKEWNVFIPEYLESFELFSAI